MCISSVCVCVCVCVCVYVYVRVCIVCVLVRVCVYIVCVQTINYNISQYFVLCSSSCWQEMVAMLCCYALGLLSELVFTG